MSFWFRFYILARDKLLFTVPLVDDHVTLIHSVVEPLVWLQLPQTRHKQIPLAARTCLSELSPDAQSRMIGNVAALLQVYKRNQPAQWNLRLYYTTNKHNPWILSLGNNKKSNRSD